MGLSPRRRKQETLGKQRKWLKGSKFQRAKRKPGLSCQTCLRCSFSAAPSLWPLNGWKEQHRLQSRSVKLDGGSFAGKD